MNPILLLVLTKLLWTPKPTHKVLGLPPPIAGKVLATLELLEDDTPVELAEQIRTDAQDVFWRCLRDRGVPDGVYELVIAKDFEQHRVRRAQDGYSWSLVDFGDFIDLGLNPHGT